MIFNEIYSAYYNTVAKILSSIVSGVTDEKSLNEIVRKNAFSESVLTILPSLKAEKWQLVNPDMTTNISHKPTMPLTNIQKQWLKAVLLDERIQLFDIKIDSLADIEPLFTPSDYVIYDRYSDGDPYASPEYIAHFRTILKALRENKNLRIEMNSRRGKSVYVRCKPISLEYSEKDDKFRLVTTGCSFVGTINLSRITKCRIYNGDMVIEEEKSEPVMQTITLKVSRERNTLERCMLHFAHFEKQAEKSGDHYLLHININRDDITELVIRVLSFGPMVEVVFPDDFKNMIIDRLKRQKSCGLL